MYITRSITKFVRRVFSDNFHDRIILDLSYRAQISSSDTLKIASALTSGRCLPGLFLNFTYTSIAPENAEKIISTLQSKDCPTHVTLDLGFTNIGAHGYDKLIEMLTSCNCRTPFTLDLSGNNLTDNMIQRFAAAIASGKCPTDLTINFKFNRATETGSGAKAIIAALESGLVPFGTRILGLGKHIENLCQQNDERIILQRRNALLSDLGALCVHAASWKTNTVGLDGFHGGVFWQTAALLTGNNPTSDLFPASDALSLSHML